MSNLTTMAGVPILISPNTQTVVVPTLPYTVANGVWIPRPTDENGIPYTETRGSLSALDSTTTPLGANATYTTTTPFSLGEYRSVVGSVFSDQDGTLFVEQSPDGQHWDVQSSISVTGGGTAGGFTIDVIGPYGRLVYTNGPTAQTVFRLYAWGKSL